MLTLGKAEIFRIEEMRHRLPIAALGVDDSVVAKHRSWLSPNFVDVADNTFELVFQTWIARLNGLVIVVDPCNGNGRSRPLFPWFDHLDTPFLERFAATGIRPEQVDLVFCTHLHCDHCGWNTQARDGGWVPTFPNARYLFVRREVERWGIRRDENPSIEYNNGVYEECVLPIIAAGLADLVDDTHRISPALMIEPAYGHTNGHSILRMDTGAGEIFFTGDVFHHPLQILDPSLHIQGDDDSAAAIITRTRLRAVIAERNVLLLPAHFTEPHGGYIARDGGDFLFKPL